MDNVVVAHDGLEWLNRGNQSSADNQYQGHNEEVDIFFCYEEERQLKHSHEEVDRGTTSAVTSAWLSPILVAAIERVHKSVQNVPAKRKVIQELLEKSKRVKGK